MTKYLTEEEQEELLKLIEFLRSLPEDKKQMAMEMIYSQTPQ